MTMRMLLSAVAVCLLLTAAAIQAQEEKGGDDVSSCSFISSKRAVGMSRF